MPTDTKPPETDPDLKLAQRVDAVETRVIQEGAPMIGSAVGLGTILGAVIGPEGAALGAAAGVVAGYLVPRLAGRSRKRRPGRH